VVRCAACGDRLACDFDHPLADGLVLVGKDAAHVVWADPLWSGVWMDNVRRANALEQEDLGPPNVRLRSPPPSIPLGTPKCHTYIINEDGKKIPLERLILHGEHGDEVAPQDVALSVEGPPRCR